MDSNADNTFPLRTEKDHSDVVVWFTIRLEVNYFEVGDFRQLLSLQVKKNSGSLEFFECTKSIFWFSSQVTWKRTWPDVTMRQSGKDENDEFQFYGF